MSDVSKSTNVHISWNYSFAEIKIYSYRTKEEAKTIFSFIYFSFPLSFGVNRSLADVYGFQRVTDVYLTELPTPVTGRSETTSYPLMQPQILSMAIAAKRILRVCLY